MITILVMLILLLTLIFGIYAVPILRTWKQDHGFPLENPGPEVEPFEKVLLSKPSSPSREPRPEAQESQAEESQQSAEEQRVEAALEGSFPASDAPSSWAGPPRVPTREQQQPRQDQERKRTPAA